jgi:hypothetical protein
MGEEVQYTVWVTPENLKIWEENIQSYEDCVWIDVDQLLSTFLFKGFYTIFETQIKHIHKETDGGQIMQVDCDATRAEIPEEVKKTIKVNNNTIKDYPTDGKHVEFNISKIPEHAIQDMDLIMSIYGFNSTYLLNWIFELSKRGMLV